MSERSLRVALLSPCFWPEVRRGAERFTRELADGLLAADQRPRLITSHPGPIRCSTEDRLPIVRLPRPPQRRLLRRGYEPYLTHVPFSYLALRSGDDDVAHAVHPPDALAAAAWKRRTGRPALLSYMGIPDRRGLQERRGRLELTLRAIRECDAVVALSGYAADAFRYWLGYEAPVIAPPVDTRAFSPVKARSPRPTIVCSAAPEEPRKNVGLLVEAFRLVRGEVPEAELLLSRPRNMDAVIRVGVDVKAPGVHWRDFDDRAALARAYGEAWAAVLPSAKEAFGLVAAEALACGTPVAGYDDGAIPELMNRPGLGMLFDRLTARALADALLEVMQLSSDPATKTRCRERAEEFSTERCAGRYLAIYRELGATTG